MRVFWLALLLAACSGRGAKSKAARPEGAVVTDTAGADTSYPAARRGALVARTMPPSALQGAWTPAAGVCRDPRSLQLMARGDSVDVWVVLDLPADSAAAGVYPVLAPGDTARGARVARVAVQRLRYVDLAYQGIRGVVLVQRLDRVVTGRFHVILREVTSHVELTSLGVFDAIRLDTLAEPLCRRAPRASPTAIR